VLIILKKKETIANHQYAWLFWKNLEQRYCYFPKMLGEEDISSFKK